MAITLAQLELLDLNRLEDRRVMAAELNERGLNPKSYKTLEAAKAALREAIFEDDQPDWLRDDPFDYNLDLEDESDVVQPARPAPLPRFGEPEDIEPQPRRRVEAQPFEGTFRHTGRTEEELQQDDLVFEDTAWLDVLDRAVEALPDFFERPVRAAMERISPLDVGKALLSYATAKRAFGDVGEYHKWPQKVQNMVDDLPNRYYQPIFVVLDTLSPLELGATLAGSYFVLRNILKKEKVVLRDKESGQEISTQTQRPANTARKAAAATQPTQTRQKQAADPDNEEIVEETRTTRRKSSIGTTKKPGLFSRINKWLDEEHQIGGRSSDV